MYVRDPQTVHHHPPSPSPPTHSTNYSTNQSRAFAPSIHGHEHVKLALLLALFSGVEKNVYNKVMMRDEMRWNGWKN